MLKKYKYIILVGLLCIIFLVPGINTLRNPVHVAERKAKQAEERAECSENLRTLGVSLAMNADELAGELKGNYPPMSSEANTLMFTAEGFLPKNLPAPELLVCPSQVSKGIPQEFDDACYFYTGYALVKRGFIPPSGWPFLGDMNYPIAYYPFDNVLSVFSDFYNRQIASAGDFKERFVREGEIDIYRLRKGVRHGYENTLDCEGDDIPDEVKITAGHIPVLIEWPDNGHSSERLGGNVLWLDGEVKWVDYPGNFPMTEEAMAVFTELAGRPPIGQLE